MAKIAARNPRFRTKQQIAADIAVVLNSGLSWGTKYAVLAEAAWVWSEFDGKFKGCTHWSPAARRIGPARKRITHEHVVPKSVIIAHLAERTGNATPDFVFEVFDTWCIGVIVTRAENNRLTKAGLKAKMPTDWDGKDPWARYRAVGIAVRRHTGSGPGTEVVARDIVMGAR